MSTKEKYLLYGVLGLVVLFGAWMYHRAAIERAEDNAALKATIQTLSQKMEERNAIAKMETGKVDQQVSAAKTPDQQAALIAALIGMKQAPTIVTVPSISASTPPSTTTVDHLPNAPQPGDMVIPKVDIPQLVSYTAQCEKDAINLAACRGNLKDTETELDTAVNANKGGSVWSRFKRNSKYFVIGGAVIAGTLCGTGHCK